MKRLGNTRKQVHVIYLTKGTRRWKPRGQKGVKDNRENHESVKRRNNPRD
jgi:hypothetical protein